MESTKPRSWFTRLTKWTARAAGRPTTFVLAVSIVCVWAITGPYFGYSNTWQLVINTATTIVTFLMVFLIQSTQNRDGEAAQVKLDEIIRSIGNARNEVLDLEELEEEDLITIRKTYEELARKARAKKPGGGLPAALPAGAGADGRYPPTHVSDERDDEQ